MCASLFFSFLILQVDTQIKYFKIKFHCQNQYVKVSQWLKRGIQEEMCEDECVVVKTIAENASL